MPSTQSKLRVTVFWGDILYDTALCGRNESISIGRDPKSDYVLDIPRSPEPSLRIITVKSNQTAELQFEDEMEGHVRSGKEILSLRHAKEKRAVKDEKGRYRVELSSSERADLVVGHVSFYFDWVSPPKKIKKDRSITLQRTLITTVLLGSFYFLPGLLENLPIEVPEPPKEPERIVMLAPRQPPVRAAAGKKKSETGGAAKEDSGVAEPTPPKKTAADLLKNMNLGNLMGGLSSLSAGQVPAVANKNTADANRAEEQVTTGGLTTQGLKTGASGKSIGIGRTLGQGSGGFEGTGRLGLAGNSLVDKGSGSSLDRNSVTDGGLDREVIDAIIRRRQDKIRLCYERQLNFNPRLSGKISIQFVIGKDGHVVRNGILEDTMHNGQVRNCLLTEVRTWTFPPPTGGTLVKVDYPFVFESSAKGAQ